MINRRYHVYDDDLDLYETYPDEEDARFRAKEVAENRGCKTAVMLEVPGPNDFPELRAMVVFDSNGREVWRTGVYDAELVG